LWNLPVDYPMVAPIYAQKRSMLAKEFGLGTAPRRSTSAGRRRAK
jgi:predicted transcriptional regulator